VDPGQAGQLRPGLIPQTGQIDPGLFKKRPGQAALLIEQGDQKMNGPDLGLTGSAGELKRFLNGVLKLGGEFLG
jgi:hypothetical protein